MVAYKRKLDVRFFFLWSNVHIYMSVCMSGFYCPQLEVCVSGFLIYVANVSCGQT